MALSIKAAEALTFPPCAPDPLVSRSISLRRWLSRVPVEV
jgi:hypothetical protein